MRRPWPTGGAVAPTERNRQRDIKENNVLDM